MAKAPVGADTPPLIPEPPPRGLEAGKCRSCGADILWGVTSADRKAPLDAKPETRMILNGDGRLVQVHAYTNHFATCPSADQHRADKRGPVVGTGHNPDAAPGVR